MSVPRETLIEIGTRWSSSLVLAEAELALHRWREDVARLRAYGWGERRRSVFESLVDRLRARHDALTTLKTIKLGTVPGEASARKAARVWLDRAQSILEAAELEHDSAARAAADMPRPGEASEELIVAVRATLAQMRAIRADLEPDAASEEFFAGGETVASTLEAVAAGPDSVAADSEERRAELDALDGEIYLTIKGLNRAGRRLFHADGNGARAARYAFQFLVTIGKGDDDRSPVSEAPASSSRPPSIAGS